MELTNEKICALWYTNCVNLHFIDDKHKDNIYNLDKLNDIKHIADYICCFLLR